jgi:hypothetical protein
MTNTQILLGAVVVLQIVTVVWLIGITSVYQTMIDNSEKRARIYSDSQHTILKAVRAVCDEAEYYDQKLEDYRASIAEDAKQAKLDKVFAMGTIQQARRLKKEAQADDQGKSE